MRTFKFSILLLLVVSAIYCISTHDKENAILLLVIALFFKDDNKLK